MKSQRDELTDSLDESMAKGSVAQTSRRGGANSSARKSKVRINNLEELDNLSELSEEQKKNNLKKRHTLKSVGKMIDTKTPKSERGTRNLAEGRQNGPYAYSAAAEPYSSGESDPKGQT